MKIDLQSFCEEGDSIREFLKTPWSSGAFSYATDCRIMIRVPRQDGIGERSNTPGLKAFTFAEHDPVSEWIAIPEIPEPKIEQCSTCDGSGFYSCGTCECEDCCGTGDFETPVTFTVSNYLASNVVMRKVATLPGVMVQANAKNHLDKKCLKFDGGLGYFMPCRHPEFSDPTAEQLKNFKQK